MEFLFNVVSVAAMKNALGFVCFFYFFPFNRLRSNLNSAPLNALNAAQGEISLYRRGTQKQKSAAQTCRVLSRCTSGSSEAGMLWKRVARYLYYNEMQYLRAKTEVLPFLVNPYGSNATTQHNIAEFPYPPLLRLFIYSAVLLLLLESFRGELFSSAHSINSSTLCWSEKWCMSMRHEWSGP